MTNTPEDLLYTKEHSWVRANEDGTIVRVGISDFAQESLGDIVAIYLPKQGAKVRASEACGEVESTKSDNDLVSPVAGTITNRNDEMEDKPEVVNQDPYGDGWLWEVTLDSPPFDPAQSQLMSAADYKTLTGK
jgi:glycine cleavage system H protein